MIPPPVQGIVIGDDSLIRIVTVPQRLDAIYEILECQGIEIIPWVEGAHAYIDDEGKLRGKPLNRLATIILRANRLLDYRDWVAGTVLILGPAPGGYEGDVPPTLLAWAQRHGVSS